LPDLTLPGIFELARRGAIVEALLAAMHNDLVHELEARINTFHWLALVLAATENEVRQDVDRFLNKLKNDDAAWQGLESRVSEIQSAAVRGLENINEISEVSLTIAEKLEKSLNSRSTELSEIISRVAKLSGSRLPPLPPQLVRPSKIVEALQRLMAGYVREKLKE